MNQTLRFLLASLLVAPLACARGGDEGGHDDLALSAPKIVESEIEILDAGPSDGPPMEGHAAIPDDVGEPSGGVESHGDADVLNGDALHGEISGVPLEGDAERGYEVPGGGAAYTAELAPDPIERAEIEAHRVDADETGAGPVERLREVERRIDRLQVELEPETRLRIERLREAAERSLERAEDAVDDLDRRTRTATAPEE